MHELQDTGTFTNLDRLNSLMAVARKDVVLSAGWDENLFRRMGELAGGNVEFRTLPVVRYDNIDGQDVNIIDPAAIKAEIAAAFGTAATPSTAATTSTKPNPLTVVDVVNAGAISGMASQLSSALKKRGYTAGQVRDRESGDPTSTTIQYGAGAETDAQNLANVLGVDPPTKPDPSIAAGHIRVTVDTNFSLPVAEESASTTTSTTTTTTTTAQSNGYYYNGTFTPYPTPDRGKPIDGGGVPCVN